MSDTFRDLSPGELQATLIQFMGQNIGEIKRLDADIIDRNNTLQGFTLQPEAVLKSLPVNQHPQAPQPPPQQIDIQQPVVISLPVDDNQQFENDPNQLLFNFVTDLKNTPSIKDIIFNIEKNTKNISDLGSSLYNLNKKVDEVLNILNSDAFKKKID